MTQTPATALVALLLLTCFFSRVTPEAMTCHCAVEYKPVCGSDGTTYHNFCLLDCERRYRQPDLHMTRFAECNNGATVGADLTCPCLAKYQPICGSDGKTYDNPCIFRCAQKMNTQKLISMADGECDNPALDARDQCTCSWIHQPVCGSDGVTYPNYCHLICERKSMKPGLTFRREGSCSDASLVAFGSDCPCPVVRMPVCGSDGKTYDNFCLFECERKKATSALTMVMDGECRVPPKDTCDCPSNYAPVCASDGKTYENSCMVDCQAKIKLNLIVVKVGPCDDATTELSYVEQTVSQER